MHILQRNASTVQTHEHPKRTVSSVHGSNCQDLLTTVSLISMYDRPPNCYVELVNLATHIYNTVNQLLIPIYRIRIDLQKRKIILLSRSISM